MDETHLADIEARCRAATPGPWDRERIESNVISDCYEYLDLDGDEPELPLLDHQNGSTRLTGERDIAAAGPLRGPAI